LRQDCNEIAETQRIQLQVKDYARRIEQVDRDVAKLKETTATKKQLADLKVDFRKLYVSVYSYIDIYAVCVW
jgi:hypothetical protein